LSKFKTLHDVMEMEMPVIFQGSLRQTCSHARINSKLKDGANKTTRIGKSSLKNNQSQSYF